MKGRFAFIASVILFANVAAAVDYGQLMARKVQQALGSTTRQYKFSTYPVDNYGLATAYDAKVDAAKEICATWDCVGMSNDESVIALPAPKKLRIVSHGVQYAEVGTGTDLKLDEAEKKAVGLKAIFPKLMQVVGLTASASSTNGVDTELFMGPATIRTLRRAPMMAWINGQSGNELEKAAYASGRLVLVYSDIVLSSLKVTLKVDTVKNADLEAKLNSALQGKAGKILGEDASLAFKLDHSAKGEYTFEAVRPLVLAVYTKKQPQKKLLGAHGGWKTWPNFDLGPRNKVQSETVELGPVSSK